MTSRCGPRFGGILLIAAIGFLSTASVFADEAGGDLSLLTGAGGAVACWLRLGPFEPTPALARSKDGLAAWDPLGASDEAGVIAGGRASRGRWALSVSRSQRTRLPKRKRGVAYLAAILETDRDRTVNLSFGSSGGLHAELNGEEILHRRAGRRAEPDTDLLTAELEAGRNLLLIRTWRSRRGDWSVFFRVMDEQFRRPGDVRVILPGAGGSIGEAISGTADLEVERTLLPSKKAMLVRYWMGFDGGIPIAKEVPVELSTIGPSGRRLPEAILDTGSWSLPFELLGEEIYSGESCPNTARVKIGKRTLSAPLGFRMRDLEGLSEAIDAMGDARGADEIPRTSVESVLWRIDHLTRLLEGGDRDYRYIGREVGETLALARKIEAGEDPYAKRRGEIQRRGYRSSVDGKYRRYALWVPPGWREKGERTFPLVVTLHGLRSGPMKALTSVMGIPLAEGETKERRERHPPDVGSTRFFVLAPDGFGSSGYAAFGEVDVEEAIAAVVSRYRIDPDRVYITGASMGGTGAASLPLHRPDLFAAAAPLCGYHSLSEYRSLSGVSLRPWEERLASFRSNADWAANGRHLPLKVVHGTRDGLRHSKSLVEAYLLAGFDVEFETPDAGHNVWDQTYAYKAIFDHFARYRRKAHPRKVTLTTSRLRYRDNRWLRVDDVARFGEWSRVEGHWKEDGVVVLSTSNVEAFAVRRDEVLARDGDPAFEIDGEEVAPPEPLDGAWSFHIEGGRWAAGRAIAPAGLRKRPGLEGPIDDAYYEPLLFVYGTANPDETALARRLIGRIRHPRRGVSVQWPVKADVEVTAEDIERRSLVVVGTARGNSLLARISRELPIRVEGGAVVAGDRRYEGADVAASFVYPNPLNPDRYVLVHTGVTPRAFFRAGHLPSLLPDWIVYDASTWERRGGLVLEEREILAGGVFDQEWKLEED